MVHAGRQQRSRDQHEQATAQSFHLLPSGTDDVRMVDRIATGVNPVLRRFY